MERQKVEKIFWKIHDYYKSIKDPKYQNVDFEKLTQKYNALLEIKPFFKDNGIYTKLINGMSQILARLENEMKLSKLSKDEIWSNLSERGMNKVIPPVYKRKNKDTTVPVEWEDKWGNACYLSNGFWGAKNYMVMDVIGYLWLLKQGGDSLPKDTTPIFLDLENVITKENELSAKSLDFKTEAKTEPQSNKNRDSNSFYSLSFDDSYFRRCTGLKMSSIDIKNLLLETARVEFKLTFPVRLKESGNKEKLYKMNFYSRFFELAVEQEKSRKDGIIQHRRYRVFFTTILGQLFINNLKAKFNNKLDVKFYTLPDSAQIFYRRALLHNSFNRKEMNRETIANIIGLKDKNFTNLTKTIEINVLGPLKRSGFIDSYSKTDGMKDVKFIIVRKNSMLEISK
jgi:hypothetical protein